ncbi:MAG TPA: hypothetical protein VFJ16_30695, partial [Longimicrobium sp.]|nr:hypothetical protein [Longimicrobium sp.]
DSSRDPLIDPLRQPAFREWPPGRGGLSKKISILSASASLQPLVDRIGASRRPAATKSAMNHVSKHADPAIARYGRRSRGRGDSRQIDPSSPPEFSADPVQARRLLRMT